MAVIRGLNHKSGGNRIIRYGDKITIFRGAQADESFARVSKSVASQPDLTDKEMNEVAAELQAINGTLKRLVMRADDEIARTENLALQIRECRTILEDSNAFSRMRYRRQSRDGGAT